MKMKRVQGTDNSEQNKTNVYRELRLNKVNKASSSKYNTQLEFELQSITTESDSQLLLKSKMMIKTLDTSTYRLMKRRAKKKSIIKITEKMLIKR